MSSHPEMVNLEQECAACAVEIAGQVGRTAKDAADMLITKALGVLQEQGLYALALFCAAVGGDERQGAARIISGISGLLKRQQLLSGNAEDSPRRFAEQLGEENGLLSRLDDLTLAVYLVEKTLIYARYHAKAMKKSGSGSDAESGGGGQ